MYLQNRTLETILSQLNPIHAFKHSFAKSNSNIILLFTFWSSSCLFCL